jgi:hypothetical protein
MSNSKIVIMKKKSVSSASAVATAKSTSSNGQPLTMFVIKASRKRSDDTWSSQTIGVAFKNTSPDGRVSFRLKFDEFVNVPVGDNDVFINMFPIEPK